MGFIGVLIFDRELSSLPLRLRHSKELAVINVVDITDMNRVNKECIHSNFRHLSAFS